MLLLGCTGFCWIPSWVYAAMFPDIGLAFWDGLCLRLEALQSQTKTCSLSRSEWWPSLRPPIGVIFKLPTNPKAPKSPIWTLNSHVEESRSLIEDSSTHPDGQRLVVKCAPNYWDSWFTHKPSLAAFSALRFSWYTLRATAGCWSWPESWYSSPVWQISEYWLSPRYSCCVASNLRSESFWSFRPGIPEEDESTLSFCREYARISWSESGWRFPTRTRTCLYFWPLTNYHLWPHFGSHSRSLPNLQDLESPVFLSHSAAFSSPLEWKSNDCGNCARWPVFSPHYDCTGLASRPAWSLALNSRTHCWVLGRKFLCSCLI